MSTFTKINSFVEKLAEGAINLGSDQLMVVLTNTAHTANWDEYADLTPVSVANLSTIYITTSTSAQTSGTYKLTCATNTMTASGAVGPFQYVYLVDDTASGKPLVGYYDYASAVTLASGDEFAINFSATDGILTIT